MRHVQVGNNATFPTPIHPTMPVDDSTLSKRYALKIALVYLLIRCIPDLLLYVVKALPAEAIESLTKSHGAWLRHVYPVLPLQLPKVPFEFQQALSLLPVLTIEVLLVFLFSAWFLRRKPWAADSTDKRRWIVLILATLIWSFAIRHQLSAYIQDLSIDELRASQNNANWIDTLPGLLMRAYWKLTALLYVTAPLWALLPVWLHFRFAKAPAADTAAANATMAIPLQRATVFASFFLGCLALHIALVQATYMGLWPWAAILLRIDIPRATLNEIGLPLSLSQIVFASMTCALAAYVYARRFTASTASVFRLLAKPLLCGIAAYLMTGLLFLALAWLVTWMSPGIAESLLRQVSRSPDSGIEWVLTLNIGAVAVLCLISGRMRESPRRWSAVLAVLVLCAAVPAYVGWTLAGSNMGMAGGKPGLAITGTLGDARWRSMEQWCTGVVETRHDTWLIGRNENASSLSSYVPDDAQDLSKLVTGEDGTHEPQARGLFGGRPLLTTLARLQDDGTFKVMATLPEVACLVASPQSDTLFLFTGVDRQQSDSWLDAGQTAVLRSSDHGVNWEWMKSGFMSEADQLAWNVKPTFTSDNDVWAWGKEPPSEDSDEPQRTALFYSMDQGKTSTAVYSPQPLSAPESYLRELTGEPEADFSSRRDMDQERFVVQLDDTHAYAWVSEFMWYRVGEDQRRLNITTQAVLSRPDTGHPWQITKVSRLPDLRVEHLSTSLDGRTYAVIEDKDGAWLAKLDTRNGEWIERHRTPALLPGWLAQDRTSTRYFWSNGDYQVVSQWGDTVVSRALLPFLKESAEIRTDAHFYTRNGGRSWRQLAIPGYLGVMGLSPRGSKLYWNGGNWYSNDEALQWQYDLAK